MSSSQTEAAPVPADLNDPHLVAEARAVVLPGMEGLLGTLSFRGEGSADDATLLAGLLSADGRPIEPSIKDRVYLWCPEIHAGWLPFSAFREASAGVSFQGECPVWARNGSDRPLDVVLRVRYREGVTPPKAPDVSAAYYASRAWKRTSYLGVPVLKHPCDLWVIQEILHEVRPDVVVETGTFKGGSALFYAETLRSFPSTNGEGRVVTIDVEDHGALKAAGHARITKIRGSSVDPAILERVKGACDGGIVLVLLDSDHSYDHVIAELRAYAPLVTPGSYLVVEDTNTPGPAEAVASFLSSPEGVDFEVDRSREKFGSTFNPGGYLRRKTK